MRIFKNRGDIYFSKANKEKSKEQKILIIALIITVVFTVIYTLIICIQSNFSAKEFFKPENVETSAVSVENTEELPTVGGKNNYAVFFSDDGNLVFAALIQSDLDDNAYKASVLRGTTELDGQSIESVFADSTAENCVNMLETAFGCDFDHYISFDIKNYESFFDSLGTVNYPIADDIKYKSDDGSYSVRLKAGEQKLSGDKFVNLMYYYLNEFDNTSNADNLMLTALSSQINDDNRENGEDLFKEFVSLADTDITIRDFSLAADRLTVISSSQSAMNVYNANVDYDGNALTQDSVKSVKSYFIK